MIFLGEETFEQQNQLARLFYQKMGFDAPESEDFALSTDAVRQLCYQMAISSRDFWLPIFEEEND